MLKLAEYLLEDGHDVFVLIPSFLGETVKSKSESLKVISFKVQVLVIKQGEDWLMFCAAIFYDVFNSHVSIMICAVNTIKTQIVTKNIKITAQNYDHPLKSMGERRRF